MFFNKISILSLACVLLRASGELAVPGKALLWTNGNSDSKIDYITKSVTSNFVSSLVELKSQNVEVVAIFKSEGNSLVSDSKILDAFKTGKDQTAVTYIYQQPSQSSVTSIQDSIKKNALPRNIETISFSDFIAKISDVNGPLNNQKVDSFEVVVKSSDDISSLKTLLETKSGKVLFVAVSEPTANAALPVKVEVPVATSSNRKLAAASSSLNTEGIYYKPEGAEYSIYYADTYLYITPDIFTGLMTGLFFFFVILIGTSCLGSIQGMSLFYDKTPPVGREA
jgi:hypothetical protein